MQNSKKTALLFFFLIFLWQEAHAQQQRTVLGRDIGQLKDIEITGRVIDQLTGESLAGATVSIPETNQVVVTNTNGNFTFKLNRSEYTFEIRFVGYTTVVMPVTVVGDGRFLVRMQEEGFELQNIVIYGRDPEKNIRSTDMGAITINMSAMKDMAPFLGEVDVIKSMATLPGVSQVGEAAAGFNVRGGGPDQNLIQFAGAPIYNPTHLFGLFTAFNPETISDVTLYKAVVPSKFGGRGSSILDIHAKKGRFDEWKADGMLSTFSGKVTAEGPIIKDKVSALVGIRGSYINWMLSALNNPDLRNSRANFYDANVAITGAINENNLLSYTFYTSYDDFALASDTVVSWSNNSHTLRWEGAISPKMEVDVLLYQTDYDYSIFNQSGINNFDLKSGIRDLGGKLALTYSLKESSHLTFGAQTKKLRISPGELIPEDSFESGILPQKVQVENAFESGIFFQHDLEITNNFALTYGLRYNDYRYLGPRSVNVYAENRPNTEGSVIGEINFAEGELIQNYDSWEPRLSVRYALDDKTSIKAGYNKMYQFIHLISNTATIAPTDFWKLSDNFILPQIVDQYSLGIYKNFKGNIFETSFEVYYKDIDNVVEYIDGADLILQNNLETQLVSGVGRAYGAEFFVKKNLGRLTGWGSYTYSRSLRRVITPFEEQVINEGNWYASNFDKPHDLNLVANYKLNTYVTLAGNFNYSTGRPVTTPEAKFIYSGSTLAYFNFRNQERIPDFHRLDLSISWDTKSNKKLWSGNWTFAVLNVYGRRNPFSLFFTQEPFSPPQAFRLSIIGVPIPTLSYNLTF